MYNKKSREGYRSNIKGIKQKTLVYGQNILMEELKMEKGTRIASHKHPQEQSGYSQFFTYRLNGLADYPQQCIIATARTIELNPIHSKGLSDGI